VADQFANWVVTVPFSEAFGQPASVDSFATVLRQFNRTDAVVCFAKLNCLLQTWRKLSVTENLDEKIAKDLFTPAVIRRVAASQGMPRRLFFPRLSILSTIKLALQVCENNGRPVETSKDVGLLFSGCLVFNEGAPLPPEARTAPATTIISQLMPLYDFTPRSAYEADVYRSLSMFRAVPGGKSCGIDFGRLFTDALGVDPQTFAEFCYAVGAQYLNLTDAALNENPRLFFIDSNYFAQTRLSPDMVSRLIDRVAISEDTLAAEVRAHADRPASDLTLLQLHPLIRHIDGRLFCLDVNFLLDKAGRGLYWTLRDAAPEALQRTLPGAYGNLFDAYVTGVFGSSSLPAGVHLPNPRFTNGDEAFDGCLVEGSRLVVFEFKSSVLRADAKYGEAPNALTRDVDRKFVTGDSDGPKGVAQLSASIGRWLGGDDISGLRREDFDAIYPVMVVLERAMTVPAMDEYLNVHFRRQMPAKFKGKKVTRLYVIDIENLERLLPYCAAVPLSSILDSYYDAHFRRQRHLECAVKPENAPILTGVTPPVDIINTGFSAFRRQMAMHLFGIDPEAEPAPSSE
jgi:hypothetical protein